MRLKICGDISLADSEESRWYLENGGNVFSQIGSILDDRDVIIANLESVMTDRGMAKPYKWATLRTRTESVARLSGLTVAVLGNNHIGDFGDEGAIDTLTTLQGFGILTVGYGRNMTDALQPLVLEQDGTRVAIVSLCCPTTNGENFATHLSPGVAPLGVDMLRRSVTQARQVADAVVVYLHWGYEQVHEPVPEQVRLGRLAVDFGADAVLGCHGHVIQSYECYRGRWIFHGLGNFVFGPVETQNLSSDGKVEYAIQKQGRANRESLIVEFGVVPKARDGALKLESIHHVGFGEDFVPRLVDKKELTVDIEKINRRLAAYVRLYSRELQSEAEPVFRSRLRNGIMAYYYNSQPITKENSSVFRKVISKGRRHLRQLLNG